MPRTRDVKSNIAHLVLLSEEDKDIVVQNSSDGDGYARTSINGKRKKIHRVVVSRMLNRELDSTEIVDHINRNRLDNRRENLRVATHDEHHLNKSKRTKTSSKYRRVSVRNRPKPYTIYFSVDGSSGNFGCYLDEEEAAFWADVWAYRILPDEAELNFPERICEIESAVLKLGEVNYEWKRKTLYNIQR